MLLYQSQMRNLVQKKILQGVPQHLHYPAMSWLQFQFQAYSESLIPILVKMLDSTPILIPAQILWFRFLFQAYNLLFQFQEFSKCLIPVPIPVKSGIILELILISESESCIIDVSHVYMLYEPYLSDFYCTTWFGPNELLYICTSAFPLLVLHNLIWGQ